MAHKVVLRPEAERDLESLYSDIRDARGDAAVAMGYLRRIRAFCEGLGTLPLRGMKRDDIRPGLRITGFERRVAIAFMVVEGTVIIGRGFYGGRDYEALLIENPGELG